MNIQKWIDKNTADLHGKTVAVTGSTGGLGKELCSHLASLGASLILLDRNAERSEAHAADLRQRFPGITVSRIPLDLEDLSSAAAAVRQLTECEMDIFIHNAGAYSIPRHRCESGYDNVFQINFATPYYMIRELLPALQKRHGTVVAVGSIAHNYSKIDETDVDFRTRTAASKVYGNAKRYLMFALHELFREEKAVRLAITHPGITFTNITAHYPKLIFAVIKHPMKVIFMKPKKAALSLLRGLFDNTEYGTWIGPALFDVWGFPMKKKLTTCSAEERAKIGIIAEDVYGRCVRCVEQSNF
jgi:NAD(P)-dependent dehydrogenase (short-subunit alcohol dehydrogenase family)